MSMTAQPADALYDCIFIDKFVNFKKVFSLYLQNTARDKRRSLVPKAADCAQCLRVDPG